MLPEFALENWVVAWSVRLNEGREMIAEAANSTKLLVGEPLLSKVSGERSVKHWHHWFPRGLITRHSFLACMDGARRRP